MTKQQPEQHDNKEVNPVEDLILREADSSNVKGGSATQSLLQIEGVKAEHREHVYK